VAFKNNRSPQCYRTARLVKCGLHHRRHGSLRRLVSLILGVVIIAVVGLFFSFVGLKAVLKYEQFAWIVFFVIFVIIYGEAGKYADNSTPTSLSGITFSGTVLTLFAIIYGSSASWCSIVSDYYVHYPVDTPKWKVFWLTTMGITIPTCIGKDA
jgi:purine-cytosine permease-like protein